MCFNPANYDFGTILTDLGNKQKLKKYKIVDKYKNLAEEIVNLMEKSMGMENHILTQEEKQSVHDNFMGVAWVLIQRG